MPKRAKVGGAGYSKKQEETLTLGKTFWVWGGGLGKLREELWAETPLSGSAQRTAEKELANIGAVLGTGGQGHPVWPLVGYSRTQPAGLEHGGYTVACQGKHVEVLGKQWD